GAGGARTRRRIRPLARRVGRAGRRDLRVPARSTVPGGRRHRPGGRVPADVGAPRRRDGRGPSSAGVAPGAASDAADRTESARTTVALEARGGPGGRVTG